MDNWETPWSNLSLLEKAVVILLVVVPIVLALHGCS